MILVGLSGILSASADVSRYTRRDIGIYLLEDSSYLMGMKNALIFWDGQHQGLSAMQKVEILPWWPGSQELHDK